MHRTILPAALALAACSAPVEQTTQPETYDHKALRKASKPTATSPGAYAEWRRQLALDENGKIAPDGIAKAVAHRDLMLAADFDNGGIQRGSWTWMGPGNVGGRCRGLWIQPTNANVMVLGSAGGGLWRTIDAGRNWRIVDDFPASLAIGCVAGAPRNSTRVWAGTGEGFGNGDAIRGAGIYTSFDLGKTFARLSTTANSNFYYVNRIAFHPTLHDRVLVATRAGLFQTLNGGVSFTRRFSGNMLDVKYHPTNGNLAICAGRGYGSVRYTLNGGTTWATATGLPTNHRRVELAYAKSNPNYVYASVEMSSGASRVYRSTNGGRSYSLRSATGILATQGWYDNAIWVDPTNPNIIVVGGIWLYRSFNGGATFTYIGAGHADQHVIKEHPGYNGTSNRQVYICNDGGIFRAADIRTATASSGWTNLNNRLGITQFYGGDISRSGWPVGGTQDNGTQKLVSSTAKTFRRVAGGDGMLCQTDPTNSNIFFGEYQYASVWRSMNGGTTIQAIANNMVDRGAGKAPWIGAMRLDPNTPNRLWMGSKRLWRTDNARATNPASVTWRLVRSTDAWYTSVDVARGNANIVVAANGSGAIYRTTNGLSANPTWTQIDGALPNRYITNVRIHPRNHNVMFVSFGGFTSGNVWRTTNAGASWSQISGSGSTGLPAAPVRGLALHPHNEGWLYAGTEVGIFASTDNGARWSATNDGPATVSVDEIVVRDDGSIWAFTHGRGIYRAWAGTHRDGDAKTMRASVTWLNGQSNGHSYRSGISGNGRFVALASDATNLYPVDTNARRDIFVRDRQEGTTKRVSVDTSGRQANGTSDAPDVSADGRFVAFESDATNLVAGDTNARRDIFVRDTTMDLTERVSVSSFGVQGNNWSYSPSISGDGRYVVFYSRATNFVSGDSNNTYDVFRHDRKALQTVRVSSVGTVASNSSSYSTRQAVSANGKFVVFQSNSTNLVSGDTNGGSDIFLREYSTLSSFVRRVSVSSTGAQANGSSYGATISADGRYIAYYSYATNLVSGDTNGKADVFLYDRLTRRTTRITATSGTQGNGLSWAPVISDDGNRIVFESDATNFVPGDTNARRDVFVFTRSPVRMRRINVTTDGKQANNSGTYASISSDGMYVSFYSSATNLVENDTNARSDVFVRRNDSSSFVYPISRANIAGNSSSSLPLSASNTRVQQAARETRARPATIRAISFRRDTRSTNSVSYKRTIDLSMEMGSTNIDTMTNRFASNWIGTPSLVITRKRFSVPDWRVRPAGVPEFNAVLPLDRPYVHNGTNHLMWDITAWANSRTTAHYIDAHSENRTRSSTSAVVGVGCTTNTGRFGHTINITSNGPSTTFFFKATGAPRSAPISLGLGLTNPNVQLPGFCTRLYTDASTILPMATANTSGVAIASYGLGAWDPNNRGLRLYTQAFTTAGGGSFSHGVRTTLPTTSPGALLRRVFASPRGNATGTLQDFGSVFKLDY